MTPPLTYPWKQLRLDRGWSQTQVIARMRAVITAQGLRPPAVASLKTMLSRWENRTGTTGRFYTEVLRQVYGLPAAEVVAQRRRYCNSGVYTRVLGIPDRPATPVYPTDLRLLQKVG